MCTCRFSWNPGVTFFQILGQLEGILSCRISASRYLRRGDLLQLCSFRLFENAGERQAQSLVFRTGVADSQGGQRWARVGKC